MPSPRSTFVLLAALAATTGLPAQPQAAPPESPLVTTQRGNLPVILSAPHGGEKDVPEVPPRRGIGLPVGSEGFFTARDFGTEELAEGIAAEVEAKTGKKPYLVAAQFHRKYIDANRPPEIAYEHPKAKAHYDAYRGTLAVYCKEVRKKYGRGLLLDVHSQGAFPGQVLRGTKDGKTVTLLRERFGEKAHTGPESFFGLLAKAGMMVHPLKGGAPEFPNLNGGHIVQTYGGEDFGIDAIQLEFGGMYCSPRAIPNTAKQVASAVQRFHQLYLTDAK
jgi:N-formylglutamate amidohydrolase